MSSAAGQTTSAGTATNSVLEKLGLLLVALVVLRLTRATMRFAYRHAFGPSGLCRGSVDFVKCGKWAGTYIPIRVPATRWRHFAGSPRSLSRFARPSRHTRVCVCVCVFCLRLE